MSSGADRRAGLLCFPSDVLMFILRLLDPLALVRLSVTSRSARERALRSELWHIMKLPKFKTAKESAKAIAMIKLFGKGTLQLDTTQYTNMEDTVLEAVATTCTQLVRVNIGGCRIRDHEVQGIACGTSDKLLGLDIGCVSSSLSDQGLRELGRCTALQELTISTAKNISDRGVYEMFFKNPAQIGSTDPFTLCGVGSGRLLSLELSSCEALHDVSLHYISRACKSVLSLDISLSDNFTSRGVSAVLESCTQLTALDLLGISRLDDEAMQFLPSSLRSLSVAACRIRDAGVRDIARRCPNLRAVDISANLVNDEGAAALASLPHLRALSLSWSCVSDRTLEAVARGIPGLLVLRLRGNLLRRDGQATLGISSNGMRAFADAHHSLVDLDAFNGKKRAKFTSLDPSLTHPSVFSGATFALQKAYQCRTCLITGKHLLCEQCALLCHAAHEVVPAGLQELYCDCAFLFADDCACVASPCPGQNSALPDTRVNSVAIHAAGREQSLT